MRRFFYVLLLLAVGASTAFGSARARPFKKVVIVILENTKLSQALAQPGLAKLARQGLLFKNYHAITHPSLPNYLALVSGTTFIDTPGVKDDATVNLNATTIVDLLEAHGKSWKTYAEDYPGHCDLAETIGHYARRHNPLISFENIQHRPERCRKIVPASEFDRDVRSGNLPDYSLYIPNVLNDGHDTSVEVASKWTENFIEPYLRNSKLMRDTLFVVTFDEDDYTTKENLVYTVFLGKMITPGTVSNVDYNHYSLLRMIEDGFGLGTLGREDTKAKPISGVWRHAIKTQS